MEQPFARVSVQVVLDPLEPLQHVHLHVEQAHILQLEVLAVILAQQECINPIQNLEAVLSVPLVNIAL